MPGVLGVFTGADCPRRQAGPIPHDPLPKTKFDMKLHRPGRRQACSSARTCFCRPTRRATSARPSPWSSRRPAQATRRRGGGGGRVGGTALVVDTLEDALEPGAPPCGTKCPGNVPDRHVVRRSRSDRRGLRRRRSCRKHAITYRPRHRRDDGAARGARPLRSRDRALHALCRLRRRGAPEARRLPQVLGVQSRRRARAVVRRRRQFWHAQPSLCRIRARAVGVAEGRPPGEVHRHALRSLPHRLSGPRPRHHGRARADARTAGFSPCAPTTSATSVRVRVAVAARQGRRPDHRLV